MSPIGISLEKYGVKLFSPKQKFVIAWDLIVVLFIFWKFLIISLSISFGVSYSEVFLLGVASSSQDLLETYYAVFKVLTLLVLNIDILVTLNTCYYESGELVTSRRRIIRNYLRSNCVIDIITIFPIYIETSYLTEDVSKSTTMKLLLLLFYLKYYNLQKLFSIVEEVFTINDMSEALFSLFKITGKVIMIAHVLACIWHSIAFFSGRDNNWMAPKDLKEANWEKRYVYSLYWSMTTMTTVGYGDITAQNELEMIFNIFTMLLGSAIFGYTINSIGYLLEKMNQKENQMKYDLKILDRYMKRKNLDYDLQVRVKKYMEFIWNEEKRENIKKEDEILKKLSSHLRVEVLMQSNGRVLLNSCPVLSRNFSHKTIRGLAQHMRQVRFSPEEIIFQVSNNKWRIKILFFSPLTKEGDFDEDQFLYILNKGEVELTVNTFRRDEKPTVLTNLTSGSVFGEISFFSEQPLNYTAKSICFSTLLIISKSDFLSVIREEEKDYETFCMIRDKVILYKDIKDLFHKCYSCGYSSHQVTNCPMFRLSINKDFAIRRHRIRMNRRHLHARTTQKSNALFNLREIWQKAEKIKFLSEIKGKFQAETEAEEPNGEEAIEESPKGRFSRRVEKARMTKIIIKKPNNVNGSLKELEFTPSNGGNELIPLKNEEILSRMSSMGSHSLLQTLPQSFNIVSGNEGQGAKKSVRPETSLQELIDNDDEISPLKFKYEQGQEKKDNSSPNNNQRQRSSIEIEDLEAGEQQVFPPKPTELRIKLHSVNSEEEKPEEGGHSVKAINESPFNMEDKPSVIIVPEKIQNGSKLNSLFQRRSSLLKPDTYLNLPSLQVSTDKGTLEQDVNGKKNHLGVDVEKAGIKLSPMRNLNKKTTNDNSKLLKKSTAEQIKEKLGVELISPTRVNWKAKVTRMNSPLKNPPGDLSRKNIDLSGRKKPKTNNFNDKNMSFTSAIEATPKNNLEEEKKEDEDKDKIKKDEQIENLMNKLLDYLDVNRNFQTYFVHNNPDLVIPKANNKIISMKRKKSEWVPGNTKHKQIFSPRRSFHQINSSLRKPRSSRRSTGVEVRVLFAFKNKADFGAEFLAAFLFKFIQVKSTIRPSLISPNKSFLNSKTLLPPPMNEGSQSEFVSSERSATSEKFMIENEDEIQERRPGGLFIPLTTMVNSNMNSPSEKNILRNYQKRVGLMNNSQTIDDSEDDQKETVKSLNMDNYTVESEVYAKKCGENNTNTENSSKSDYNMESNYTRRSSIGNNDNQETKISLIRRSSVNSKAPLFEGLKPSLSNIKEETPTLIPYSREDSLKGIKNSNSGNNMMSMISLFKREDKKTLPPIPANLLSINKRRKSSLVYPIVSTLQTPSNKQSVQKMLSVFTKVVRAISIMKYRAGLLRITTANENQVQIINDWSYFEATVNKPQKVTKI